MILKQRKDAIIDKRGEKSRQKNINQLSSDRKAKFKTGDNIVIRKIQNPAAAQKSLSQALRITQKNFFMTSVEKGQLVSGIEQIVRRILFPIPKSRNEQQLSEGPAIKKTIPLNHAMGALLQDSNQKNLNEPVNISNQSSPSAGMSPIISHDDSGVMVSKRRSIVLSCRHGRKSDQEMLEKDNQNSIVLLNQQKGIEGVLQESKEEREKKIIEEKAQKIIKGLSNTRKMQFLKIFNTMPVQQEQEEAVVQIIEDMIIKMKSKSQRQELQKLRKDLIMSNARMQQITEHYVKHGGPMSPLSYSTEAKIGFIGNIPLQEPPYTLNYMRD